jgi:putative transposase
MKDYKSGSHAVWDCKYHLIWITKYRYPVLAGDVSLRAREVLREISRSVEMTIDDSHSNRSHLKSAQNLSSL